jgi:site-specific DNA recombinase
MDSSTENLTSRYIALYCRVSTDEQAREGLSLAEQEQRLIAYCKAMGWDEEIKLFIDDGYSAKNLERPKLESLLNAVQSREVSRVIVTKLDRMSRKLKDLLALIDTFEENKVSFISIGEMFDTHTPSGRLTLHVLGAVAEFERERIRERVVENMHHAAKKGKWLTQHPYGYRLDGDTLKVYLPEAEVVKKIYNQYLDKGLGFFTIAKKLNEQGIPSRHNKEWSLRAVKLLLQNPVYKGTLVWNRRDSTKKGRDLKEEDEWIVVDDCLPPIIDKIMWENVQEKIGSKKMHPRAKTSPHLLGGLLKCGKCGAGMSIGWSGSANKRYRVYRCSANKNKGTCTSQQYKADEVEHWFKVGLLQLTEGLSNHLIPHLIEKTESHLNTSMEQRIRVVKTRYKRKVEAYTAGLIELEELTEEKNRMEGLIQEAKNTKSTKENIDISALEQMVKAKMHTILDAMDQLPVEEAKAQTSTFVEKVILLNEKDIEIVIRPL